MKTEITYTVGCMRAAGLKARWSKNQRGAPMIFVLNPASKLPHQRETWWAVTASMFESMKADGVLEGFNGATLIGDIFSISA